MHVFAVLQEHLLGWSHSAGSCLDPASPDHDVWAWHSMVYALAFFLDGFIGFPVKTNKVWGLTVLSRQCCTPWPSLLCSAPYTAKGRGKEGAVWIPDIRCILPSCKLGICFSLESGPSVYPLIQVLYCWAGRGKPALSYLWATLSCLV